MKNTVARNIKKARCSKTFVLMLIMSMLLSGCGKKSGDYSSADTCAYYNEDAAADTASMGTMNSLQKSATGGAFEENAFDAATEAAAEAGSIAAAEAPVDEGALDSEAAQKSSSGKLIRDVNINMETTQLDELTADITKRVQELGGYIEYSWLGENGYNSDDTRYVNYTLRIPAEKLDEFLNTALTAGRITSRAENVEDITLKYSDLESKVRTLETEQERLLELIRDAQDVDAIIALETRLSEIRYELDSIKSSLKLYDNRVTYSTVTFYISEVKVVSAAGNAGFAEKVAAGFSENILKLRENLENAAVALIISIPTIIVIIIFAAVLLLILKPAVRAVFKIPGIKKPAGLGIIRKKRENGTAKAKAKDENTAEDADADGDKDR